MVFFSTYSLFAWFRQLNLLSMTFLRSSNIFFYTKGPPPPSTPFHDYYVVFSRHDFSKTDLAHGNIASTFICKFTPPPRPPDGVIFWSKRSRFVKSTRWPEKDALQNYHQNLKVPKCEIWSLGFYWFLCREVSYIGRGSLGLKHKFNFFTDGLDTVCIILFLLPHAQCTLINCYRMRISQCTLIICYRVHSVLWQFVNVCIECANNLLLFA